MSRSSRPLPVRIYRALFALLPDDFDARFGDDAGDVFADLYHEATRGRGRIGATSLWLRSVGLLCVCVFEARRDVRRARGGAPAGAGLRGGGDSMEMHWHNLKLAARSLTRHPGFAFTVVTILAVGIGATTTIFSVVDLHAQRAGPPVGRRHLARRPG